MAEIVGYKFRIYRSTNQSGPYTKIGETTGNTFEYDDSDVVANQSYYYCLTTVDTETGMESIWTTPVSCIVTGELPPSVPTGLTVTDNSGLVALEWNPSNPGDNPMGYYFVWRSLDGTDYNIIGITIETTYTDLGVTPGETYYYYVSAVDIEGLESDHCAPVSTVVQGVSIPAPTNFAGLSGADAIKFTWNAVSEAEKYRIYQGSTQIAETEEISYIYVNTNHASLSYTVRAVNKFNQESANSNSVQVASVAPSATITFPASPFNSNSHTVVVIGTSQKDFSIEYVELKIVKGSETSYSRAAGAENWQCSLTLSDGTYTIQARAKSIAGNLSNWSAAVTINVAAPATVYKFSSGSWIALNATNIRLHSELNKVATASFTLPDRSLAIKDRVSIQSSEIAFLGRVLTVNHTESGFWDYSCVDESYILQKINTGILNDQSWAKQGNMNSILRALFATLASEGYINFSIEASSQYNNVIDPQIIIDQSVWGILEKFSSISSDVFYFDSKFGKLVFKPKTPATSSLALVYGQNVAGWNYEEHRENIVNIVSVKGHISDKKLPILNVTPNYIVGLYPGDFWSRTTGRAGFWGQYTPSAYDIQTYFKIDKELSEQEEIGHGRIGIKMPLPPVPKSTIRFKVPVIKKGNPGTLRINFFLGPTSESLTPVKVYTFNQSEFSPYTDTMLEFSFDINPNPSTIEYLTILFDSPDTTTNGYYMLRWILGDPFADVVDRYLVSFHSLNNYHGLPVAPVVGGLITTGVANYWTEWDKATGTKRPMIYNYYNFLNEYEINAKMVLLGGGLLERAYELNIEEYTDLYIKFVGRLMVDFWTDDGVQQLFLTGGESYSKDHVPLPTLPGKTKAIRLSAYTPYVVFNDDVKFTGISGLLAKKKITDLDPSSTSILDYGLCPNPDSGQEKAFSSIDEMNAYVDTTLLTQSEPLISLTVTYPYIANPSLPSTIQISIPEVQDDPLSLKVIGCDWDLVANTTDLIFEAAPLNYVVQTLKKLQRT